MTYLIENAGKIFSAITAIIAAASAIANLTPSDSDNQIIAKVSKIINLLAINWKK